MERGQLVTWDCGRRQVVGVNVARQLALVVVVCQLERRPVVLDHEGKRLALSLGYPIVSIGSREHGLSLGIANGIGGRWPRV